MAYELSKEEKDTLRKMKDADNLPRKPLSENQKKLISILSDRWQKETEVHDLEDEEENQ